MRESQPKNGMFGLSFITWLTINVITFNIIILGYMMTYGFNLLPVAATLFTDFGAVGHLLALYQKENN